jgi:hypothetical protein
MAKIQHRLVQSRHFHHYCIFLHLFCSMHSSELHGVNSSVRRPYPFSRNPFECSNRCLRRGTISNSFFLNDKQFPVSLVRAFIFSRCKTNSRAKGGKKDLSSKEEGHRQKSMHNHLSYVVRRTTLGWLSLGS